MTQLHIYLERHRAHYHLSSKLKGNNPSELQSESSPDHLLCSFLYQTIPCAVISFDLIYLWKCIFQFPRSCCHQPEQQDLPFQEHFEQLFFFEKLRFPNITNELYCINITTVWKQSHGAMNLPSNNQSYTWVENGEFGQVESLPFFSFLLSFSLRNQSYPSEEFPEYLPFL